MVSLYTFEATDCLSSQYPVPALRVHAAVGCGRAFNDVAAVLEPDSPNPCLLLNKPLGVNGVQAILDSLARHKGEPKQAVPADVLLVLVKLASNHKARAQVQADLEAAGFEGFDLDGLIRTLDPSYLSHGQIMRAERWDADLRRISESKGQVWGTVQFQKPVHGYKVGDTVQGILTADLEGWTLGLFDSSATRRQIDGLKHDEVTFSI